jgi:hypothetical protein
MLRHGLGRGQMVAACEGNKGSVGDFFFTCVSAAAARFETNKGVCPTSH